VDGQPKNSIPSPTLPGGDGIKYMIQLSCWQVAVTTTHLAVQ